jgi:hypothetical protein
LSRFERKKANPLDLENFGECLVVGNNSSTRQLKTRFLSAESAGDVIASAFGVLRVDFVLSGGVRAGPSFGLASPPNSHIKAQFSLSGSPFSFSFGLLNLSPKDF